MNLFSSCRNLLFLVGFVLTWGISSFAVNVKAIYTSACQRDIGLIVGVNQKTVSFLTIEGKLKKIRPHEIIYLSYYPMDRFPLAQPAQLMGAKQVQVKTQSKNKIVPLVDGWPIDFTSDKIAFLSVKGRETVINRRNIHEVKVFRTPGPVKVPTRALPRDYAFIHPYVFRDCPLERGRHGKRRTEVYPQQVLSQPVVIKRELDRLRAGYKKIDRYNREQDFYPVPEVYKNRTSLGLWEALGSRYGSSKKRTSNLAPVLTDSYSSDVFDYQHLFVTGSAPMPFGIHEEPQVHGYYGFKASYFHFAAMVDPNMILVGENYKWQPGDFDKEDDKVNDMSMIEMGFDFGPLSIQFYLMHVLQVGISAEDQLYTDVVGLPRFGLSWQNHLFKLEANYGQRETEGDDRISPTDSRYERVSLSVARVNFSTFFLRHMNLMYSLIYRTTDLEGKFQYGSTSLTNALYADYIYRLRYNFGGYAAVERHENEFGVTSLKDGHESVYIKGGAYVSLSF